METLLRIQYLLASFAIAVMVVAAVAPFLKVAAGKRRDPVAAILLLVAVIGIIQYGATKQTRGYVTFPYTDVEQRYLYDDGSYVTNDIVHLAWSRSPVVPASADFVGAVRPVGNTNDEDWVIFFSSTFARVTSPTNIPYAGAMTNNFQFFTTWTPGPSVHTNGTAVILWQTDYDGDTNRFVTYRTGIYANTIRLAPNANITNGPAISATFNLTAAPAAESEE